MKTKNKTRREQVFELLAKGYATRKEIEESGVKLFSVYLGEMRKKGYDIKYNNYTATYYVYKVPAGSKMSVFNAKSDALIEERAEATNVNSMSNKMYAAILSHLEKFKTINAIEAMEKYNCFNLPHAIFYLRKMGYKITYSGRKGFSTYNAKVDRVQSVGNYILEAEPEPVEVPEVEPIDENSNNDTYRIIMIRPNVTAAVVVATTNGDIKAAKMLLDTIAKSYSSSYNETEIITNDISAMLFERKKGLFKKHAKLIAEFIISVV